jgi:hypothetical protein
MPTHPKLIETGRALRASDKEGGRTLANSNTRLRSTIPLAAENFHQALDDLESDIVNNLLCIVVEFMLIHKTRSEQRQYYFEIWRSYEPNESHWKIHFQGLLRTR